MDQKSLEECWIALGRRMATKGTPLEWAELEPQTEREKELLTQGYEAETARLAQPAQGETDVPRS
jgi:hypothetical protein